MLPIRSAHRAPYTVAGDAISPPAISSTDSNQVTPASAPGSMVTPRSSSIPSPAHMAYSTHMAEVH